MLANTLRLGWGAQENGLALAVVGVGSALVQGLLVRRIVPRVGRAAGGADRVCAARCLAYLPLASPGRPGSCSLGVVLQAFGAISGPAVQSLFSARAGADQQGRIQGALGLGAGADRDRRPARRRMGVQHLRGRIRPGPHHRRAVSDGGGAYVLALRRGGQHVVSAVRMAFAPRPNHSRSVARSTAWKWSVRP